MSSYTILTKGFWADTLERTVATAAQAVAATWGADILYPNAFQLDYKVLAGVAAGGALAALVKQVAKLGLTAQVPEVPVEPLRRSGGDVELVGPTAEPFPPLGAGEPVGAGNDVDTQPVVQTNEGPMFH